jgi:hypothetical protein
MKKHLTGDYPYASARLILWYRKHNIREIHTNKLIRDCERFAKLFNVNPKDLLNHTIDNKFVIPQGSESWLINRDA